MPHQKRRKQSMSNNKLGQELKALGIEMASALKAMKESKEFKQLEKDLARGIKSVSSSLGKALKAAHQSKSTSKLKKRIKRVIHTGREEGKIQAQKAQVVAAQKIKQASHAIKEFLEQINKNKNQE